MTWEDVADFAELDYERPLWECDLAESWERDRFNEEGGDLAEETWDMVQVELANTD